MSIKTILDLKTIAVVGISDNPEKPSNFVAKFLEEHGYIIIPVNPNLTEWDGKKCYPDLLSIPVKVDIVDIFRRPEAIPPIVDEAIAIKAKVVWMQEGIVNEEATVKAREAGLEVVMDRCMKKEFDMSKNNTRVLVVFYSMTGNVAKLAKEVANGAGSVQGIDVKIRQVDELIPKEKFNDAMKKVKEELKDIPIATMEDLEWADGIAFGTPTRFGNMSSQMKNFIDRTGGLWQKGALINKVAGVFTSTSTQHGGQETTIITSMVPLLHHGMIILGVLYSEQALFSIDPVSGGSPYGASSVSGPMADRSPTENDLAVARALGKRIAETSKKIAGK